MSQLENLTREQLAQIDSAVCDFESSLTTEHPKTIEIAVAAVAETLRPPLLLELIATDIDRRRLQGQNVSLADYVDRFPESAASIRQVFDELGDVDQSVVRTQQMSIGDTDSGLFVDPEGKTLGDAPTAAESDSALPRNFGRYRLERVLGSGGMGTVYLALDTQLNRRVALKIPKFSPADSTGAERFLREARAMAMVEHPNLCPIHDVGKIDGQHFLTMTYLEGPTLAEVIEKKEERTEVEVIRIVTKLAQAVQVAHEAGIVHRDLKPSNVIFNRRNEPVVMDFGLARPQEKDESTLTHEGMIVGSPAYMAPEQVEADVDLIGSLTDVYALGVILYELISGQRPYQGSVMSVLEQIKSESTPPVSSVCPAVSSSLDQICRQAMARDIDQRFTSANDLAEALAQCRLEGQSTSSSNAKRIALAGGLLFVAAAAYSVLSGINPDTVAVSDVSGSGRSGVVLPDTSDVLPEANQDTQVATATDSDNARPAPLVVSDQVFTTPRVWDTEFCDVDHDGDLDLILASSDSGGGRIWFNDGSGRFEQGSQALPSGPRITTGDLDYDGDVDLWIAPRLGPGIVMLNDGDGQFEDTGQRFESVRTFDATFSDLDGDGDLDCITSNGQRDREVPNTVYLNDGAGNFEESDQKLGSGDSRRAALFDADGDGDIDFFSANDERSAPSTLWVNDGKAAFTVGLEFSGSCGGVASGDVDGDGDEDFVLATTFSENQIWLSNGDGSFESSVQFEDRASEFVTLADLDLDGDQDIINITQKTNDAPGSVDVWWNGGSGDFTESSELVADPSHCVAIGDVDGDGDLDLAIASRSGLPVRLLLNTTRQNVVPPSASPQRAAMTPNNSKIGFETHDTVTKGRSGTARVALADIDGDSDLDVITVDRLTSSSQLRINDGTGTFSSAANSTFPTEVSSVAVCLGDIDADGDVDAVLGAQTGGNSVFLNDGTGSFSQHVDLFGSSRTYRMAMDDIDGDGNLDVAVVSGTVDVEVWLGNGAGDFVAGTGIQTRYPRFSLTLADVDQDELPDLFVGGEGAAILVGNPGDGRFRLGFKSAVLGHFTGREMCNAVADLDGDGDLDVVSATANPDGAQNAICIQQRNGGRGRFERKPFGEPGRTTCVQLIDINGDGLFDIVLANVDTPVETWLNDGTAQFSVSKDGPQTTDVLDMVTGDLDGDGDEDLYFVRRSGLNDAVWLNGSRD